MQWESDEAAAHRRLIEEMWLDCPLTKVTEFIYHVPVPPNLIEHEYLHVFTGIIDDQTINPNPEEVMNYRRITTEEFTKRVNDDDPTIAPWTKITRDRASKEILTISY